MLSLFRKSRVSPIGVDLGSGSVKLLQMNAERTHILEAVRWDVDQEDAAADQQQYTAALSKAVQQACEGRDFRGRDAVLSIGAPELFVQNIRVPKAPSEELQRSIFQEAAGRIPFPVDEAEIRFIETVDVRQGDTMRREVIVMAVHRPVLEQQIDAVIDAGLRPVAVDAEPGALLRCYAHQYRRDEDHQSRSMLVNVGSTQSVVVIAQGSETLFIKYIDVGGHHMDQAVARHLSMPLSEAAALRRHNGDRRSDQQDPEVAKSIQESVREVIDQLAGELSMCLRYHSVTFRGQPLARLVLGGGEASSDLIAALTRRVDVKCELGDPLRRFQALVPTGRNTQWDIAAGLALRKPE